MTVREMAERLRRESNARDDALFFSQCADTLEALEKALKDADYRGECVYCVHRGSNDSSACEACDCDCRKCEKPCPCMDCKGGSNWEWSGNVENA